MAVTFALACPADEAEVRRMLRENPVGGGWRIALEREPDGLGGPHLPDERRMVVLAREGGRVIGICERVVRPAFVDGRRRMLPYLGALRVAASHRHRITVLRGGFARLRDHAAPDECRFALTSIAADNAAAQRVLTAGLRDMPVYRPVGDYVTLMLRAAPSRDDPTIAGAAVDELPEITAFLQEQGRARQFAPAFDAATLAAQPGLSILVRREHGALTGVVALWDQRAFRQTRLCGMPPLVARLRRPINCVAPALGLPSIPAPQRRIEQVFLAFLAVRNDDRETAHALVRAGSAAASRRGAMVATIGLPAASPCRTALRWRFRAMEYRTRLFAVHWPDDAASVAALDARPAFPEAALL